MFKAAVDLCLQEASGGDCLCPGTSCSTDPRFSGPIGTWDTSSVTSFADAFRQAPSFNQDISTWDTSSAIVTRGMFNSAVTFNQDISQWDVSSVTDTNSMCGAPRPPSGNRPLIPRRFRRAHQFNQPLGEWDTSLVMNMNSMFYSATAFDQDISRWDTSRVWGGHAMFRNATKFDSDITHWDNAVMTDSRFMFMNATAWLAAGYVRQALSTDESDGPPSAWDFPACAPIRCSPDDCGVDIRCQGPAKQCLGVPEPRGTECVVADDDSLHKCNGRGACLGVSLEAAVAACLAEAPDGSCTCPDFTCSSSPRFVGPIGDWDVRNIATLDRLFESADLFDADIGHWDVSAVTSMQYTFSHATAFNADLSTWDTSSCFSMAYAFYNAQAFRQDLGQWDTSSVTSIQRMFYGAAAFDSDISAWDVARVWDMRQSFEDAAAFTQDITGWNSSSVTFAGRQFDGATGWTAAYDTKLINSDGPPSKWWARACAGDAPCGNLSCAAVIRCTGPDGLCDLKPLPVGTSCGARGACNASGTCVQPPPPPPPAPTPSTSSNAAAVAGAVVAVILVTVGVVAFVFCRHHEAGPRQYGGVVKNIGFDTQEEHITEGNAALQELRSLKPGPTLYTPAADESQTDDPVDYSHLDGAPPAKHSADVAYDTLAERNDYAEAKSTSRAAAPPGKPGNSYDVLGQLAQSSYAHIASYYDADAAPPESTYATPTT